jgi:hypothetical protein
MIRVAALLLLSAFALAPQGAAAQGQVYDPQPPAGSAFLRVANALPGGVDLRSPVISARRLGAEATQRVTEFNVVPNVAGRPVRLEFSEGGRSGEVSITLQPGSFVTVLLHRDGGGAPAAAALVEQTDFNRARARLAFYNGAPECREAGLALQPGGQAVFAAVPALGTAARSVAPASADLLASCAGAEAARVTLQGLEPGGMYSIWLIGGRGAPLQAFMTRDATARWQR